jgi:hypothetical protein
MPESPGVLLAPKITTSFCVPENEPPLILLVVEVVPPAAIAVSPVIAGVCVPARREPNSKMLTVVFVPVEVNRPPIRELSGIVDSEV